MKYIVKLFKLRLQVLNLLDAKAPLMLEELPKLVKDIARIEEQVSEHASD